MQQLEEAAQPGEEARGYLTREPDREQGAETERAFGQTAHDSLAQIMQQLVSESPARKQLRQRCVALCFGATGVTAVSGLLGALTNNLGWMALGQMSALATLGVTSATLILVRRQLRDRRLRQIADLDDVHAIGPLLDLMENSQEMWEYDDPSRRAIKAALVRLLPRLQASDAGWMTDAQRAALARTLYYCTHGKYPWHYNPDLAVALLAALEQVGDSDALDYVRELAHMSASKPDRKRIRDAALSCVPFLQEREREKQAMQTLLRASQESIDPNVLMRPLGAVELKTTPDPNAIERA